MRRLTRSFLFIAATLLATFLASNTASAEGDASFGIVGPGYATDGRAHLRFTAQALNVGGEVGPRLAVRFFNYDWQPGNDQHGGEHWFSLGSTGVALPAGPVTASVVWDIFAFGTAAEWVPKTSLEIAVTPGGWYEGPTGALSIYMLGLHDEFTGPATERFFGAEITFVTWYIDGAVF